MSRFSVLFSAVLVAGATTLIPAGAALAAPMPKPPAPTCALFAQTPVNNGNTLSATGGRVGCSNTAKVTVRLVTKSNGANQKVVGEMSQSGKAVKLAVMAPCSGHGKVTVHTETMSSTGAIYQSPTVTFAHC